MRYSGRVDVEDHPSLGAMGMGHVYAAAPCSGTSVRRRTAMPLCRGRRLAQFYRAGRRHAPGEFADCSILAGVVSTGIFIRMS